MIRQTAKVWAIPLALALLSAAGLLSALLGDEVWDAVSWITLATPLAVLAWCIPRR